MHNSIEVMLSVKEAELKMCVGFITGVILIPSVNGPLMHMAQ